MKKYLVAAVVLLSMTYVQAGDFTGNTNFFLGQKFLEKDDWAPLENQTEIGVMVDFKQEEWPVSIAVDLLVSSTEEDEQGIELTGSTIELNLGVRKIFEIEGSSMRPYIGGGLAFISAEYEGSQGYIKVSDDDSAVGVWANAGVYWTLNESFNVGLDLRYSKAEVTLFDVEGEAGGTHVGLLLGYHW